MFRNVAELIEQAEARKLSISEVMIQQDMVVQENTRKAVIQTMEKNLAVMESAVHRGITEEVTSHSGLTGGDARRLQDYMKSGKTLSHDVMLDAVSKAMATNEVNAAMGMICATPTAGSAGVVPGTLFALDKKYRLSAEQKINYLFTAGAFGFVVANNASISGAAGGCQAEVGTSTGMAAAAIVEVMEGTPKQSAEAMAIALKNMLGLVCDPVAGLVEVPCVKRNAMGASNALIAADMALAGIESRIPCDEVIEAMYKIGQRMPIAHKETALGGLAATPTGKKLAEQVFSDK